MWPRKPPVIGRPASAGGPPRSETDEALLRRLRWTVLRPLAARFGGDERSLLRGPGMELLEVREYQPGDDVRHIDWNVTARSEATFVRETQAERALDVWLVVDVSASLNWGTAGCLKRERGAEFTAVVGRLLGSHGNRVGALMFADRPLGLIPPATGRAHQVRLLARLREAAAAAPPGATDLAGALAYTQRVIRQSAVVLVVSDFIAPEQWAVPLRRLAVQHEVVAVRLTDPREAMLPDVGLLTVEDPETGQQLIVDTSDRRLRERFAAAAAAHAARVRAALTSADVELLTLSTDAELLPPLVRFLSARRRQRRQSARPAAGRAADQGGVT